MAVVDPQDSLEVGEQFITWQEPTDALTYDRLAPQAPADQNLKAEHPVRVTHQVHTDIVHLRGGTIHWRPGHCNLELARQIVEFGVNC